MTLAQNRLSRYLLLTALLVAVTLAGMQSAMAGGHTRAKPKIEVTFDPEKRSDITGTVLVTGANRGIGLALARNYAERGWTVIATARKPEKADELNALAANNDRVTVERMDLLDHEGIDALAEKLRDVPIDVLLNNAAILGDPDKQMFGSFDYDTLETVVAVNVTGTLKMAEAFAGHVAASDQKKIVGITSAQGSIELLRENRIPFYKLSKTALNMGYSSVAKSVKKQGITVALISPGAVDTQMMNTALKSTGIKRASFLITPEQSAEAVINVIDQYELQYTGVFMAHTGDMLPW